MDAKKNIISSQANGKSESSPLVESSSELSCLHCNHTNEEGALYCAECGATLQQAATCPKCNTITRPRADICEVCGEWLLTGQCKFCYSPIDNGEVFCGECGNPAAGIVCPHCGKLSIFDFCKSCGIPLSIQAKEIAHETANDPAFQEMVSLFEQLSNTGDSSQVSANDSSHIAIDHVSDKTVQDDRALQLKSYRESLHKPAVEHKPKSAPKAFFSSEQKERISHLNEEVVQEEERRRIEEERRKQEEERKRREAEERRRQEEEERQRLLQEQLNDAMCKFRGKTFSSNQEARRFFMNIIAGLPEEVAKKITNRGLGWRCNAYDCVHDLPSDCADPSRGGVWLIR